MPLASHALSEGDVASAEACGQCSSYSIDRTSGSSVKTGIVNCNQLEISSSAGCLHKPVTDSFMKLMCANNIGAHFLFCERETENKKGRFAK